MNRKAAVVLDATPTLRAEPMDSESSDLRTREIASNAVRHEFERLRWNDIREDQYLVASIAGTSLVMLSTEQDKLSGESMAKLSVVDPQRFYPDPSATRIHECRFVIYEPSMDLSEIMEQFPEKGGTIKPQKSQPVGKTLTSNTVSRSDDEIINAPGNELGLDVEGNIRQRVADVAYVWIKDETLTADVQINVVKEPMVELECQDCGLRYEPSLVAGCPQCGSPNSAPGEGSEMKGEESTTLYRKYPYGRLIVICQDVLLYDGPAPLEIDCIFPFFPYSLYRIPNRFHGYGDVALLKSNQQQMDKNMAQLIDNMRISVGYLQVPANEPAWGQVTNEPGQKVPTRSENAQIAKWIGPQPINPQLHGMADEMMFRDFQRESGEPDSSVGSLPTAPEGNASVHARESTRTSRIGKHLKDFNQTWSEIATSLWQVMNQLYLGPRNYMVQHSDRSFEAILMDVSQLPRGLRIRVEADIDSLEKDKLSGQNLVMAMQSGVLPMMPDVLLRAMGTPDAIINEVMQRPEVQMHMMMQQQLALSAAANGATPQGASPGTASPTGTNTGAPNSNNSPGGEQ